MAHRPGREAVPDELIRLLFFMVEIGCGWLSGRISVDRRMDSLGESGSDSHVILAEHPVIDSLVLSIFHLGHQMKKREIVNKLLTDLNW